MIKRTKHSRPGARSVRSIKLHAQFTPESLDAAGRLAFMTFWVAANEYAGKLRNKRSAPRRSSRRIKARKPEQQIQNARDNIADGLSALLAAATAGNAEAVSYLTAMATQAAGLVRLMGRLHPELLRTVARSRIHWPERRRFSDTKATLCRAAATRAGFTWRGLQAKPRQRIIAG